MTLDKSSDHHVFDSGNIGIARMLTMIGPLIIRKVFDPENVSVTDALNRETIQPEALLSPSDATLTDIRTLIRNEIGKTLVGLLKKIALGAQINVKNPVIILQPETDDTHIAKVKKRYGQGRSYPDGSILRCTISFDSVDARLSKIGQGITEQHVQQAVEKLATSGISFVMAEYEKDTGSQAVFYLPSDPRHSSWKYITMETIQKGHAKVLNQKWFQDLVPKFASLRLPSELRKYLESEVGV